MSGNGKREKARERRRRWRERNIERARESARRWAKEHREQVRETQRRWRLQNPGQRAAAHRRWFFKNRYGMTIEDYDALLQRQGMRCAVCGRKRRPSEARFPVDHCHVTGRVRGILCTACNKGIGHFGDDTERIEKALAYLRRAKQQTEGGFNGRPGRVR